MVNSTGSFQSWISAHQLRDYPQSSIGWIFGLNTLTLLFGGVMIGPVCDSIGPRIPLFIGSILCVLFWAVLGLCTRYWHFIMTIGVLAGISSALLYVPAVLTVGQYFSRRRGIATGITYSGGSFGGIILPIMLQSLLPRIGFAWTTRVIGLITLVLLIFTCLLAIPRLPPSKKPLTSATLLPQWGLYRIPTFAATTLGIFFLDLALFLPLAYLPSYTLSAAMSEKIAFYSLTFLNAGSCIGRWAPAYAADVFGRFNTMICTVALCALSTLTLWLLAGSNVAMLVSYAVVFGFASGSNLSLTPVCVGQLCTIETYGRYYSSAILLASFGSLGGNPIAGALLTATNGHYWSLIVLTGLFYVAALICFCTARVSSVGFQVGKKVLILQPLD